MRENEIITHFTIEKNILYRQTLVSERLELIIFVSKKVDSCKHGLNSRQYT